MLISTIKLESVYLKLKRKTSGHANVITVFFLMSCNLSRIFWFWRGINLLLFYAYRFYFSRSISLIEIFAWCQKHSLKNTNWSLPHSSNTVHIQKKAGLKYINVFARIIYHETVFLGDQEIIYWSNKPATSSSLQTVCILLFIKHHKKHNWDWCNDLFSYCT